MRLIESLKLPLREGNTQVAWLLANSHGWSLKCVLSLGRWGEGLKKKRSWEDFKCFYSLNYKQNTYYECINYMVCPPITLLFEKQWQSDTSVEFAALFWKNRTPHTGAAYWLMVGLNAPQFSRSCLSSKHHVTSVVCNVCSCITGSWRCTRSERTQGWKGRRAQTVGSEIKESDCVKGRDFELLRNCSVCMNYTGD